MSTQPAPSSKPRQTGAERTRRWRERMRAKGLVPRTVWTYDVTDPAFLAALRSACERVASDPRESDITREMESMAEEDELRVGADVWTTEPSSSSS